MISVLIFGFLWWSSISEPRWQRDRVQQCTNLWWDISRKLLVMMKKMLDLKRALRLEYQCNLSHRSLARWWQWQWWWRWWGYLFTCIKIHILDESSLLTLIIFRIAEIGMQRLSQCKKQSAHFQLYKHLGSLDNQLFFQKSWTDCLDNKDAVLATEHSGG